jgi:heptosyltransferase-2
MSYFLTDRVRHTKQLGEKHESEYNLDLVRYLGIHPKKKKLFMGVSPETKAWVRELFIRQGIKESDKLLAIHPGASCPSKVWPNERFSRVADSLIEKSGFKVVIVAGQKDAALAQSVVKNMRHPAVNLAGETSVAHLAGVLKRCRLLISNDSGPVHVACAVGTPVISVFGRSQAGLSPKRWGPSGARDKIMHKDVGCVECLAHNCVKEFACIKAVTTEDVLHAVELMQKEGVDL